MVPINQAFLLNVIRLLLMFFGVSHVFVGLFASLPDPPSPCQSELRFADSPKKAGFDEEDLDRKVGLFSILSKKSPTVGPAERTPKKPEYLQ